MPKKSSASGKERIKPPTSKTLTDASKELKKGHSAGGRGMADESVAVRQGVAKGKSSTSKKSRK